MFDTKYTRVHENEVCQWSRILGTVEENRMNNTDNRRILDGNTNIISHERPLLQIHLE